jgi:hypothetical protein
MPRPQSFCRGWRTAASPRRCTSRAAGGRRHPPRYRFYAASADPPARSDRPASADRVIATRGKGSCRGRQPYYRIRFVSRDPAAIGLPREESPSHARRTTASPRLRGSPGARTRRRPPRYGFARDPITPRPRVGRLLFDARIIAESAPRVPRRRRAASACSPAVSRALSGSCA